MTEKIDHRRARPAPGPKAPPKDTPRDRAEQHELRIFRSYQTARPVRFNGLNHFVQAINTQLLGGDHETTIWLMGDPAPRRPEEIEIIEMKDLQP